MAITKATASSIAPAAKGDLVAGSATNDAAVLGVGANNTVLTADSAEATGLKWATPSQVLLNTTTFSAVSSQSVNDVFSSSYAYYRLYFTLTANSGTNAAIKLAMRVSSTDTQMTSEFIEQYASTITGVESGAGGSGGFFVKIHTTYGSFCKGVMDIIDPNTASVQTNAFGRFFGPNSIGQPYQYISAIYSETTTQFTGFTITPSTGTMSGTLRVYGVTI